MQSLRDTGFTTGCGIMVNMLTDRCRIMLFGSSDFELCGEINFSAGRRLSYYVITRLMEEVPSW